MSIKRTVIDHIKNIGGFTTNRKLIVFAVDDYGNVRVDSKEARQRMNDAGLKSLSRFDAFDTMETKEDLEILYECLRSVKDKNGNAAVFTPYALPCNINFEAMAALDFDQYIYELLPETFVKLENLHSQAYSGAWSLWKTGIKDGLMAPQFHGREHFNLNVFQQKLKKRDATLLVSLKNRSYASITNTEYATIGSTSAFEFWNFDENVQFKGIIIDGLKAFKKVYGYQATNFNAPGAPEHHALYPTLKENGIKYVDTPWAKREHQGNGKYHYKLNFTGNKTKTGIYYLVRNVVFEPTETSINDWIGYTMKQIQVAFSLGKPAVISSHRVNFCGHIDPQNRKVGITALKALLKEIIKKWPSTEFISASGLGDIISQKKTN